jgi:endonuclease-3 related protein
MRPLVGIYRALRRAHGPQGWWPGESPFEVVVGAVLTQNTAWKNVEKALTNLRGRGLLAPQAILATPRARLRRLLRPAGYFRVKEARLRSVVAFWHARGGEGGLSRAPLGPLRRSLLAVHGVGPETADSILLYALGRPTFVVDAYTRRIFRRLGLVPDGRSYEEVRAFFEAGLPRDVALWNDFHAQIVRLGHTRCRPDPRCAGCPLEDRCLVPRGA